MAKIIVKHPRVLGGVLFQPSAEPQHLDDEHLDHWFAKAMIEAKDISLVEEEKPKAALKQVPKAKDEEAESEDSAAESEVESQKKKSAQQPQRKQSR